MGKVYVFHLTPSSSEEQRAAAVQRLGEQIWIFMGTLGQGHWPDINLWVFFFFLLVNGEAGALTRSPRRRGENV